MPLHYSIVKILLTTTYYNRICTNLNIKKEIVLEIRSLGAGDRARTGTLSPAADFESATSTNSITPAYELCHISITESLEKNNP